MRLRKMRKMIIMSVVILSLLIELMPVSVFATSFPNTTIEPANYTSCVTSVSELVSRIEALAAKYDKTHWTSSGAACSAHGEGCTCYSKYYYGWQCFGFAKYIFNDLFCCGNIGRQSSYTLDDTKNVTLVGIRENVSVDDISTAKSLLQNAQPGDFIQIKRRKSGGPHSIIVISVESNGIWFLDDNSDGHCTILRQYQDWGTFLGKNISFSLYHSTKYPDGSIPPSVDFPVDTRFNGYVPFQAYAVPTGKVTVYSENRVAYSTSKRYIDGNTDLCTINEIYTDGFCSVTYPTSSENKTALAKVSDFIPDSSSPTAWTANYDYTAYRRSGGGETIGSVSSGSSCLALGTTNGRTQVIYPTSSGHQMGWIEVRTQPEMCTVNIWHYFGDFKNGEGTNANGTKLMVRLRSYEVEKGSTFVLDEEKKLPICNGMRFNGICTASITGSWSDYPIGTSFTVNSNAGIEFHYVAETYSITYNLNGGVNSSSNPNTYAVFYGVSLQNPTRPGWRFAGWRDQNGNIVTGVNEGMDMSCTESGLLQMTIALKRRTTGNITLSALWEEDGHSYSYRITKAPTIDTSGAIAGTCSKCGGTTTVTLPVLDTTNYNCQVIRAATCSKEGSGRYTWKTTTYGTYSFEAEIPRANHTYDTFEFCYKPTFTSSGCIVSICSVCDSSYVDYEMPILNNTDYTVRVVRNATCSAEGATRYTWKNTEHGVFYVDVPITKLEHQYTYSVTTKPTFSSTGVLTGTCGSCSGTTTVALPVLDATSYICQVIRAATCSNEGSGRYTWKTTTYGTYSFEAEIPRASHTYDIFEYCYEPTFTSEGCIISICSVCDNSWVDYEMPILNNTDYTVRVVRNATCSAEGATRYTWKNTEHGVFYVDVPIAKLAHQYAYSVTTNPTLASSGILTGTCSTCTGTKEITLPKLNATSYTYQEISPSSCSIKGTGQYTWNTTIYGIYNFNVALELLEHSFEGGICSVCGVQDPNCLASGIAGNLTWILTNDGMLTISGIGDMDAYAHSGRNAPWYEYRTNVRNVIIQDGVTSVGTCSFYACSNLVSVSLPESLTSIKFGAFEGCSSLNSINIPEKVTSIGTQSFYGCSSLTSISIPDGVTTIGKSAFYHNSSLTSISIPEGVTRIDFGVFSGCSGLTSISIPESVTYIGKQAFYDCSNLSDITIPKGVTSIEPQAFYGCSSLTKVTIPDGVTIIEELTFYGCSSLTSVIIPNGVTSIGDLAFSGCSSLANITIPENVTSIGKGSFSRCSSLTSITIPKSVAFIGECGFFECTKMSSITFVGTAPQIDKEAFYLITANVYYPAEDGTWNSGVIQNYGGNLTWIASGGHVHSYTDVTTAPTCTEKGYTTHTCTCGYSYKDDFVNPLGHTEVGIPAVEATCTETGLTEGKHCSVCDEILTPQEIIPALGHSFTKGVCTRCGETDGTCGVDLTWTLEDGLLTISGTGATYDYEAQEPTPWTNHKASIRSIVLESGVTGVGNHVFNGFRNLERVTIPGSVTSIGNYAFHECSSLADVHYDGTAQDWEAISIQQGNENLLNASIHVTDPANQKNGLVLDDDGIWRFYRSGAIDTSVNGMQNVNGYYLLFRAGEFNTGFTGLYNETCFVNGGYLGDWYTGMYQNTDGSFYLLSGGWVDTDYTGIYEVEGGGFYIRAGKFDTSVSGIVPNRDGRTAFVYSGYLAAWYTGLYGTEDGGLLYLVNGWLADGYTGIFTNEYGTFLLSGGRLNRDYTGVYEENGNAYFIYTGYLASWYTGLYGGDGNIRYFVNGQLATWYNGVFASEYGTFLLSGGVLNTASSGLYGDDSGNVYYFHGGYLATWYTGLYGANGTVYYMTNGILATWFTDIYFSEFGNYLLVGGVWDTTYTGNFTGSSGTWYIYGGIAQYQV